MQADASAWRWARVALWVVWGLSVFAACYAAFVGAVFWSINCPQNVSAQGRLCESIGDDGGYIAMGAALAVATGLSFFLLRRSGRVARTGIALLLVAVALMLPPVVPVLTFAALSAPDDYCTPEQERAEEEAVRTWEAEGGRGARPDWCTLYEGQ